MLNAKDVTTVFPTSFSFGYRKSKPLVTNGIVYDQLAESIRNSKIFTGNDLGMLANVEILPEGTFSADGNLHTNVQKLLLESKISEAWESLRM